MAQICTLRFHVLHLSHLYSGKRSYQSVVRITNLPVLYFKYCRSTLFHCNYLNIYMSMVYWHNSQSYPARPNVSNRVFSSCLLIFCIRVFIAVCSIAALKELGIAN